MREIPSHTLNDGTTLPAIGFGTYKLNGEAGAETMQLAIHEGYRLLDSAFNYENEGAVGAAARRGGAPREELRLCSKLPGRHHRYDAAIATVEESLFRAGLDYWDLYLIHWPNPHQDHYVEAWTALIELRERGLIRSIGVCNFLPEHLQRLETETSVLPSVNQIELHPRFPQTEQRLANDHFGVRTQSWSPLGRAGELLNDLTLTEIAAAHEVSVPRVILRWHLQLGAVPIPKASHVARQQENLDILDFTLSAKEMAAIDGIGSPDGRLRGQDPAEYEEF